MLQDDTKPRDLGRRRRKTGTEMKRVGEKGICNSVIKMMNNNYYYYIVKFLIFLSVFCLRQKACITPKNLY